MEDEGKKKKRKNSLSRLSSVSQCLLVSGHLQIILFFLSSHIIIIIIYFDHSHILRPHKFILSWSSIQLN